MAKKRKKAYVPPVGRQLPACPESPGRGDMWSWIGECLLALATWVPVADEPETMGWDDPGESIRKERWEKIAVEEEFSGEARRGFEELLEKGCWPDTSEQACFVMRERLHWASRCSNQFAVLARLPGCGALKPLVAEKFAVCHWLAFEVYDAQIRWPKKWWDGSSFEDSHGI